MDALVKGKTGKEFDPALLEQGLVSEYAASGLDEDWATVGAEVMADRPQFWDKVARYPRLREKARLAVAFYRRSMPGIRLRNVESPREAVTSRL